MLGCALTPMRKDALCRASRQPNIAAPSSGDRHDLRVSHLPCLPGRLPALLKRFETATIKIWEKHGIKPAGFWTVLIGDGNHDLYYFIAWELLADREKKWAA